MGRQAKYRKQPRSSHERNHFLKPGRSTKSEFLEFRSSFSGKAHLFKAHLGTGGLVGLITQLFTRSSVSGAYWRVYQDAQKQRIIYGLIKTLHSSLPTATSMFSLPHLTRAWALCRSNFLRRPRAGPQYARPIRLKKGRGTMIL